MRILIGFTLISHPFVSNHTVRIISIAAKSIIGIKIHGRFSFFTSLGGDNYDPIRTGRTVNSCRGGILQHIHAFNIRRIDLTVTTRNTIDNKKRCIATVNRTRTTKQDFHILTHLTACFRNIQTCHFSLQSLHHIVSRGNHHIGILHRSHGTCEVAFLHRTITDNHHFIKQLVIRAQPHCQVTLTTYFNVLGLIANV